jgi:hypothetical protein
MTSSRDLAVAQALAELASTEPMCISVLTLPKLIDVVLEEGKLIDNILALLEADGEPICVTERPTPAGAELPSIVDERLETLKKLHLDIDHRLRRVRDLVQALRMRIV